MSATTMHAHTPGSYSMSLVLHGLAVLAFLLPAYVFNKTRKNTRDQIIELVAGPGDNYMATAAPAIGSPDATGMPEVTFTPPVDRPRPSVVETPPNPVVAPPQNPVAPTSDSLVIPPPKKTPEPKAAPKPTSKTAPKTDPPKATTWAEFDKHNAGKNKNLPSSKVAANKQTSAAAKPVVAPKVGKGIAAGVLGGTGSAPGAGGTALTAAERDQMEAYFALLAQRIREAQEKPEGLSTELVVRIEFQVYASGAIGAVKIIRSSGNRAFDDSVLKAFRSVRPVGPRPDGKSDAKVADFRMREAE